MNISKILGIVNSIFHKVTRIPRTTPTPQGEQLLEQAIRQYQLVKSPDSLAEVVLVYLYILADGDEETVEAARIAVSQSNILPPSLRERIITVKSKLVFKVPSVAGPARFCRVPFYPVRDQDSWTSRFLNIDTSTPSRQSFGIDEIGDDPILNVGPWLSTSDTTKAGPYTMATEKIAFGAYRLIGLEIAAHNGARYIGAIADSAIATGSIVVSGAPVAATGTVSASGPTAVAATGELRIIDPPAGMTVTIQDALGTTVVFTAVIGAPGVNQFEIDPFNVPGPAPANLAATINANAFLVSANDVGDRVALTMDTVGTVGNGKTLTTSNLGGISVTSAFSGGVDNVTDGTTITVIDSAAVSVTFTAKQTPVAATDFQIDNVTPANTIANFRDTVNANAFDVTALAPSTTATLTQGTTGLAGNTTLATSNATEFTVVGFSGGTFSVPLGATIQLEDTSGTTATLTATAGATTATAFTIAATISDTIDNIITAIGLAGLAIAGVNNNPTLNLGQNVAGLEGNTTIVTTGSGGTLTPTGFANGANISLNLVNDLSPIALSIRELTVYNGDNILIVEDSESVPVESFNVLTRPETFQYEYTYGGVPIIPTGQPAATLANFKKNTGYKFIGLRDQPIVDTNTQVFVKVEGFIANQPTYNGGYPANTPLPKIPPISLSINLVVDLLEDKIFGDPAVPSPASRPGANIKLGARRRGATKLLISNSNVRNPNR